MGWFCFMVIGFALVPLVVSDGNLLEPCAIHDMECLSHSTEQFLGQTSKGIPNYNIKAIDPLVLPGPITHEVEPGLGIEFHFENVNVTGLKNQKISDFQMDTTAKSVLLKTSADLNIIADIKVKLDEKQFTGVYQATASVLGTARYNYDLIKDSNNVEYFVVGPETLTCEIMDEPKISVNKQLEETLDSDPDAKVKLRLYLPKEEQYRKQTVCKITEKAYEIVVHNIRAAAKVLPKTAFFKDI